MPNDLDLIKQLEKEIGKKLDEIGFERIVSDTTNGYSIDASGAVTGLNFDNMALAPLPLVLSQFQRLKKLSLYNNKLKDISSLQGLRGLSILDLRSNYLSDISSLHGLTGLRQLRLSSNRLSDISSLSRLRGLSTLDLRSNHLSDISSLQRLHGLSTLDLRSNHLTDISSLQELKNLKRLNLMYNKLKELPESLTQMGMEIKWDDDGKDGIFIGRNHLKPPPPEITNKGNKAIMVYFRSLKTGREQPFNEVKVLLVGDGGAGKTSLVKRLLGQDFNEKEDRTDGINIVPWEITSGSTDIKVHLWDFGGQEIMHATHQFFLSKRSLYVLVLDGRKDEKTEYWLKHIESFGGDSPVLVVINKIDENPGFEVNRKFLMGKYKIIKGFFRVSCKTREGIIAFIPTFRKALTQIDILKTVWSGSWFNVKMRLENMEKHFVSYQQYIEICEEETLTDESEQDTLVDFLNDLGVILHFKDFDLEDTHVLAPEWVTGAVYRIINSEKLATCKGVLNLNDLGEILKKKEKDDYYYPLDKYRYIIGLMKKFELCYEIDPKRVLIPDLLKAEESTFDFDYEGSLKFIIDYDFLPKSVMPRFIVRRHKDIKNKLQWRTGVVLEDKAYNATAVVKSDHRDRKVFIHVSGQQKRDYFSIVRKTFRDINDSFEKLITTELVPLPNNDKVTVEYDELIGLEQMGKDEVVVGKLKKSYSVSKLLDGIEKPGERPPVTLRLQHENEIKFQPFPPPPPEPKKKWYENVIWKIIAGVLAAGAAIAAIINAIF